MPRRYERLLLAAILLLAALLRLGWLGIVQFGSDQARIVSIALELVQGRSWPAFGTGTSFGLPTPPLSEYLYALPTLLSSNPLWLTWFTAAVNVLAVALCWQLSRRYWGQRTAVCATLLFATNPWAVFFSRGIWQPNLLPLFVLCWAVTGEMAFYERRRWAVTLHLLLLSIVVQLHYSGLALVPVSALLVLWNWTHIDRRALAFGVLGGGLAAARFASDLLRTGAAGLRAGLHFVAGARVDAASARLWWISATGMDVHSLAGYPAYRAFLGTVPNMDVLRWALGVLVLGGLGAWLWESLRNRDGRIGAGILTGLWGLAPLILLTWHSQPLYLHYYVVAIPALCLAAGFTLARALSSPHAAVRIGAASMTFAIAVAQTLTVLAILRFVGTWATPGGFGVPLQYELRVSARATEYGVPVAVLVDGDDSRSSTWLSVFEVLLQHMPHRVMDGTRLAVFPPEDSAVLITPGASTATEAYAEAGLLNNAKAITNRRGEEPFLVLPLAGGQVPGLQAAPDLRRLAHGAEIVGYRVEGDIRPGQAFDWWIAWRAWSNPANTQASYHIFNHLVDAEGNFVAQADGPTMATQDWVVGELVLEHFRIELPAQTLSGPLWMRVGMYAYPELQNQSVLDASGQPVGDSVGLGPLAIK